MTLTDGLTSVGVKDYMNSEIIAKGAKFTRRVLEELDFNAIQVSAWTNDDAKNELIKQVILNYLKKYKELDAELRRKKFDLTIGDELPTGIVQMAKVYIAKNVRSRWVIRWPVVTVIKVSYQRLYDRKICHSWKTVLL